MTTRNAARAFDRNVKRNEVEAVKYVGFALALLLFFLAPLAQGQSAHKKKVNSEADLPRFTYPVAGSASALLQADSATFNKFAAPVRVDLESILRDYDIGDKATLRTLLLARLDLQQLAGENEAALQTIESLRAVEEKPAARLTTGLLTKAILQATIATGATSGPAFEQTFKKNYDAAIHSLQWDVVRDSIKEDLRKAQFVTKALEIGSVEYQLDPAAKKSGVLDNEQAWTLLRDRAMLQFGVPLKAARTEILRNYVASNTARQPDIWQARDVTLTNAKKLTPVLIGIWDDGVDVTVYRDQIFDDPHPTASGAHGLAFDDQGISSRSWLYPLPPTAEQSYSETLKNLKGRMDMDAGTDSAESRALVQKTENSSPEELRKMMHTDRATLVDFAHGTHVAGIAVRGNPASRIVVFRFDDGLPRFTFPASIEWANRLAADFQQISEYCRTRHVRVVNMSWADSLAEFETWLSNTGAQVDPAKRKSQAQALYQIWRGAIEGAIRNAPATLFVAAAGNSDSNASFDQVVPAALHLPNLITVGAVDQSGEETSFTSYGDTVVVDADGYEVESFLPGGTRLKLSGTSMAAPQVTNLAAKLFALDPSLTPEDAIRLIRQGATTSKDGRLHLINPKRSVELLESKP
ncbi:MAG TPA: S8 family serine peptidase [Candidatus Methylomirabilis sp.]|nr:S8 family serine peptidase [Candidatus Methylomirabilis sp.]